MTSPNVLLLHCHDLGRFLGSYGIPTVRTPHLDAFAAESVRFADAYCTAPQCSPARGSLFTGLYPQQHGVLGLTHEYFGWDLRPEVSHLAALLGQRGYASSLIGVHHESRSLPDAEIATRLGFDDVHTGGSSPTTTARAVAKLGEYAATDRPFYLQVGFHEPHRAGSPRDLSGTTGFLGADLAPDDELGVTVPPYLVDDAGARTEIAELQGAVAALDAEVGAVLTAVSELEIADRTIVIFTTDHGLALPRAKCTLYDPGLEVALIIRAPGFQPSVASGLVSHVDVVPTLLELLASPTGDLPGRSLVPMLSGARSARTEIFGQLSHHDYYDPRRCIRTDRHKLIVNFSSAPAIMDSSQSWLRRSTPRGLVHNVPSFHPPVELYDLWADPVELTNLGQDSAHENVRHDLLARLADWMGAVQDPLLAGPVSSPMQEFGRAALPS